MVKQIVRWVFMTGKWVSAMVVLGIAVAWQAGVFYEKIPPHAIAQPLQVADLQRELFTVHAIEDVLVAKIPGTIAARHEVVISARVMATISELTVRAGDSVDIGQLLVKLDSRDLQAQYQQAESNQASAQSRLELAQTEYQRVSRLFGQNVIPRTEFDRASANLQVASAEVMRSLRALEEARVAVSYTSILAPFTGRVIDRLADLGDIVAPAQPILKMYDPSNLRLEAFVRESLVTTIRPGDAVTVEIDSVDKHLIGQVEEIVPQSDPGARAMLVKVALDVRDDLYPGLFGRLVVSEGTATKIKIPSSAVRRVGQLVFVEVFDAETQTLQRRFIQTGWLDSEQMIEVLAGLEQGEQIAL